MGSGLLAVKRGFNLINWIYQFFNNKRGKGIPKEREEGRSPEV
jgi:hypothetical protein